MKKTIQLEKRKHRLKEIFLGFGILIVLILITPAVLSLFFHDIAPVSAPDLAMTKVRVPVSENSHYDIIKLEQASVDVPKISDGQGFMKGALAGVSWDQATVDEAITKNTEALGYFSDAAKKSQYQFPAYADPTNLDISQFPLLHGLLVTSKIAALNALNLQKQGKEQEALQQAFDIMKVGQGMERSQTALIGFLVGANAKILGMQTIQRLLANTSLSASDLASTLATVQSFTTDSESVTRALKTEYTLHNAFLDQNNQYNPVVEDSMNSLMQPIVWRGWVPKSYYYQPNKMVAETADAYRSVIAENALSCDKTPTDVPRTYESYNLFRFYLRLYFLPNAVGQLAHENSFFPGVGLWQRHCDESALQNATETMIALKAYTKDKGSLPASLNDLVPGYLASVPVDPYDGKAIKYSAEKKIVYSVGNNHTDVGGSTGDDWQKMDDPTFLLQW